MLKLVLRRGSVKHHLSLPESDWLGLLLDNSWGPDFHQSALGMERGEAIPFSLGKKGERDFNLDIDPVCNH